MQSKLFPEAHDRGAWKESKSYHPFFRSLLVSGFTRPDHCPAPWRGIAGRSFSAARIWRRCSALSAVNWKPYSVPSARTTFAGITCLSQSGSGISSVTDSLSMRASATNAPTPLSLRSRDHPCRLSFLPSRWRRIQILVSNACRGEIRSAEPGTSSEEGGAICRDRPPRTTGGSGRIPEGVCAYPGRE